MRGLFINCKKSKDSIYESGLMVYNTLRLSNKYLLDYTEITENENIISTGYNFYFFNYHHHTMRWLDTRFIKELPGLKVTMVLEILPNDPFVLSPENRFDAYVVLDPTLKHRNKSAFAFPRPLEKIDNVPAYIEKDIPVIGTFGFSTKGKGFHHVVEAVNKEFEKAIVRINIPFGTYVPDSEKYAAFLANLCKEKAKPGIEVVVTHDYMDKEELIKWCSENTLNCFLYDRDVPGLAATTDQAIISDRPLSVSENNTFRHILEYITPYPKMSLKESIENSLSNVRKMAEDWLPENFAKRFEYVLTHFESKLVINDSKGESFVLKPRVKGLSLLLSDRYIKYKRLLSPKIIANRFSANKKRIKNAELI